MNKNSSCLQQHPSMQKSENREITQKCTKRTPHPYSCTEVVNNAHQLVMSSLKSVENSWEQLYMFKSRRHKEFVNSIHKHWQNIFLTIQGGLNFHRNKWASKDLVQLGFTAMAGCSFHFCWHISNSFSSH